MTELYPIKFQPLFKDKIWGGNRIKTSLGMDYDSLPNCGEAWVLSGVEGSQTVVANGFLEGNELNELIEIYMGELVGDAVFERFGNEFPLLIKFIDTNDWLSIQVHPDDELAEKRGIGYGKTEMWYILDAEKDSKLISGFRQKVNANVYQQHLQNKTLSSILNYEEVNAGDVFFMPAGRVHAIGPNILLAEIQQTSDTTYRIYDWDRTDDKGSPRQLHIDQAMEAIDFEVHDSYKTQYHAVKDATSPIINSPYFNSQIINLSHAIEKDYSELDSFVIYICVSGICRIESGENSLNLRTGETCLIPADLETVRIFPEKECKLLEVFIL